MVGIHHHLVHCSSSYFPSQIDLPEHREGSSEVFKRVSLGAAARYIEQLHVCHYCYCYLYRVCFCYCYHYYF